MSARSRSIRRSAAIRQNFDQAVGFFKDSKKNQPIVPKQTSYARVVSGEIPILFDYDFNAYRGKYTEKGNFEFVIPCEGTVTFPYVVGLTKNAPNKAKAKKVLDFLLSDKGQAIWTNAYLRPARNVPLPDDVSKKFLPAKEYERAKSVDWGKMATGQKASSTAISPKSDDAIWCPGGPRAPFFMRIEDVHLAVPAAACAGGAGVFRAADGALMLVGASGPRA